MSLGAEINHPTQDPSLPSFVHPALAEIEGDLQIAWDAWNRLRGAKETYLPKEPGEKDQPYRARVDASVWTDLYRSCIEGFSGVLARFEVSNLPPSMERSQSDVDLQGNSIQAFFLEADNLAMRDGAVPIIVEMPAGERETNADVVMTGVRPYLVIHPRRMMINWRTEVRNGAQFIRQATFLEFHEFDDGGDDGEGFGVTMEPRYRVMGPGWWRLLRIADNNGGELAVEEVDSGFYLDHRQQPLDYVPVVWYTPSKECFGEGDPPMQQAAVLNILHFQKTSDYDRKEHLCNLPVPVVIGEPPPPPGKPRPPLVLGPNSALRLPQGASFQWAEPDARSLAESRARIAEIEEAIKAEGMQFAIGGQNKTAMQSGLEAAQTQATVTTLAEQKENVIQQIAAIWCDYTGETLSADAGISLAGTLFDQPLEPDGQRALADLTERKLMSRQSAIEELQRAGAIRATTSAREELDRIRREAKEEMLLMIEAGGAVSGQAEADGMDDADLPASTDRARGDGGLGPVGGGAGGRQAAGGGLEAGEA